MQRTFAMLAAVFVVVTGSSTAFAWGHEGHEMVGAIADKLLEPHAAAKVKDILGEELRVAAPWPDCVRSVQRQQNGTFTFIHDDRFDAPCTEDGQPGTGFETPDGKARMQDYARRNWATCSPVPKKGCHTLYHFDDVATQRDHYDRAFIGTSEHDIVSAMLAAIAVLRDQPEPTPFHIKRKATENTEEDKKVALYLLAHFVGDVHQPLHVGATYLSTTGNQIDPDATGPPVDAKTDTHGGNSIEDGGTDLHTEWDEIDASLDPTAISNEMLTAAKGVAVTPGDLTTWPAAWASDTIVASHAAFSGVSFTRTAMTKPGEWTAQFVDRDAYMNAKKTVQGTQLAKGGARLAQLLNAIWP
jgi:hypothetical protein